MERSKQVPERVSSWYAEWRWHRSGQLFLLCVQSSDPPSPAGEPALAPRAPPKPRGNRAPKSPRSAVSGSPLSSPRGSGATSSAANTPSGSPRTEANKKRMLPPVPTLPALPSTERRRVGDRPLDSPPREPDSPAPAPPSPRVGVARAVSPRVPPTVLPPLPTTPPPAQPTSAAPEKRVWRSAGSSTPATGAGWRSSLISSATAALLPEALEGGAVGTGGSAGGGQDPDGSAGKISLAKEMEEDAGTEEKAAEQVPVSCGSFWRFSHHLPALHVGHQGHCFGAHAAARGGAVAGLCRKRQNRGLRCASLRVGHFAETLFYVGQGLARAAGSRRHAHCD